jgi:hypothetical protein
MVLVIRGLFNDTALTRVYIESIYITSPNRYLQENRG